jgi:Phage capsid family
MNAIVPRMRMPAASDMRPGARLRPATHLTRAVFAKARASADRLGGASAEDIARSLWGDDEPTRLILRAAVVPASTTGAGWANTIAATAVADFVASLATFGAAAQVIAGGVRVDLDGVNTVSVPRRATAVDSALAWIAEGAPIPVKQDALDAVSLSPRKFAVAVGITREMSFAEPVVETLLREDAAASLDASMFSTTAGSATRPPGLLAGIAPLTAAAGGGEAAMLADLAAIAAAVGTGNVVYVMPPTVAAVASTLLRNPATILTTQFMPADSVIGLDPRALVSGFGPEPQISTSIEATVHFEDTSPQPIGTAGTPNVVAAPTRNAFQQDLVLIRLIMLASWALRAPAVAWVQGVTWA